MVRLRVEFEREVDGRWICSVPQLPGAMAYGATKDEALRHAEALALTFLADKLEHGEAISNAEGPLTVSFVAA
jgi:predicted RNase H-like HicB family nuclease